jgi:hypothetical protein
MSREHFRDLCGVEEGQPWPRPDEVRLQPGTGERFYTPDFMLGVLAKVNRQLFNRVVTSILDDVVSVSVLGISRLLTSSIAPVQGRRYSTRGPRARGRFL